jgi:hypothetical protein
MQIAHKNSRINAHYIRTKVDTEIDFALSGGVRDAAPWLAALEA